MRDIGKNIRIARVKKNITQDELAEKLYVTRQTVSNYENGKSRPDIEMLISVSEVLDVELNELLYGAVVPPDKAKAKKQLQISVCVLVALSIALAVTVPCFKWLSITKFVAVPLWATRLLVIPMLMCLAGWTVMQALNVFFNIKKPCFKLQRLLLLSLIIIVLLMFLIMFFVVVIEPLLKLEHVWIIPTYVRLGLISFFSRPYVFLFFGAAFWLFGSHDSKSEADRHNENYTV